MLKLTRVCVCVCMSMYGSESWNTQICNCHNNENTKQFHHPKNTYCPFVVLNPAHLFAHPVVLPFPECHISGILEHVTFPNWLLSLSICAVDYINNLFLLLMSSIPGEDGCQSIHQLEDVRLFSSFWRLWIQLLQTFVIRFCVSMVLFFLG